MMTEEMNDIMRATIVLLQCQWPFRSTIVLAEQDTNLLPVIRYTVIGTIGSQNNKPNQDS